MENTIVRSNLNKAIYFKDIKLIAEAQYNAAVMLYKEKNIKSYEAHKYCTMALENGHQEAIILLDLLEKELIPTKPLEIQNSETEVEIVLPSIGKKQ